MQRSDAVTGRTITFKGIDFVIGYANGAPTTLIGDLTALFLFTKNGVGAKVIFEDCSWNFNLGTNSIIPAFVKAKQVYFRNGVIDIDTTSVAWTSGYSCSTGIDCEECHVTQSQITLYNSDNSNGYDLNFINNCNYAKVDGNSITLSGASRLCRTANSADIVVSHNTIHLKSVTSSISSYDSTKPYQHLLDTAVYVSSKIISFLGSISISQILSCLPYSQNMLGFLEVCTLQVRLSHIEVYPV